MTPDGGARPAVNRPGTDSSVDRFVMVPVDLLSLVADHKISPTAAWLYVVMLSCHNRKRGDDDVWPSRKWLAERIGMTQPRGVDKYVSELTEAGLITVTRRNRPSSTSAKGGAIHDTSRYTLLLTVKSDTPKAQQAPGVVRNHAPPSAQSRTTPSAQSRTTPSAQTSTRTRGSEPDESELDEMNNILAPRASRGSTKTSFDDPWSYLDEEKQR